MEHQKEAVQGIYYCALKDLAEEKGADYAFATAAETIAKLLSMVSRGMGRSSELPMFLPPEQKHNQENP